MEWTVGQEVAVLESNAFQRGLKLGKIKRIMKAFVELEDGSKWRRKDGYVYPYSEYSDNRITAATDEHRDRIKRNSIIRFIEKQRDQPHKNPWQETSTKMLNQIAMILKSAEDKPMKDKCKCGSTVVQGECMRDGCEG